MVMMKVLFYSILSVFLGISSLLGNNMAAPADISTVRMIVLVPSDISFTKGIYVATKLAIKQNTTRPHTTLSFLACGIITAKNIPYRATLKALTKRSGSRLPAITPSAVPIDQNGMVVVIAP